MTRALLLLVAIASVLPAQLFAGENGYELRVDGVRREVADARCSAMPFNRRWPGRQRPLDQTEICGFARLTYAGRPLSVEVDPGRDFASVAVLPSSRKVAAARDGRRIRMSIDRPGAYSVEVDGPSKCLFLFVDPADVVSPPSGPKVRRFGPGEHDVGLIEMKSGETLYLDEGAIVYGRVTATDATNICICGRGILDASRVKAKIIRNDPAKDREERERGFAVRNAKRYDAVRFEYCTGVTVRGIVIRDSPAYTVRTLGCRDVEIAWVKVVGNWRYNSDGFNSHNSVGVRIHDCFLRTFDDSICMKGFDYMMNEADMLHNGVLHDACRDVRVERCTIWCDWGKSLEIGAETRAREICDITFRDCDVINNSSACDVYNVDYGDVHDILFEDIRIDVRAGAPTPALQKSDDDVYVDKGRGTFLGGLLRVSLCPHPEYSEGVTRLGKNRRITFRNIQATGPRLPGIHFIGYDADHRSSEIVIDGISFNGRRLKSDEVKIQANAFADFSFR